MSKLGSLPEIVISRVNVECVEPRPAINKPSL